jgi:hypothetical protein
LAVSIDFGFQFGVRQNLMGVLDDVELLLGGFFFAGVAIGVEFEGWTCVSKVGCVCEWRKTYQVF